MQAQVLLGAQLLHSVIRKFLRCFLPLAGHIAGGSAQAFQLFAVRFNLGFRLFAGVFCLGGGRSVLPQLLFQRGDLLPAVGGSILTLFQRGVQLIQLHLGFQAGRSGGHALALGTGQLGGQVIHLRFAGGGFLFGCCAALVQFQHLGTQFVQFLLAAEHTHAARGGTAGKGTACVDDLAVHCDNAVAVAKIFGHHRRFAQILHHNNAAQQVINNMLVLGGGLHQVGGHLRRAGQAAIESAALHGIQRQEGCASGAFFLQKGDGRAGAALVLHHNVLQRKAKCRFNRDFVPLAHAQDTGHRADDAPQPPTARGAHDGFYALLIAVHIALQILQNADALGGVVFIRCGLLQSFSGFRLLAATAFQLEL